MLPLDPLLDIPVKFFLRFMGLELGCLVLFSRVSGLVIFRHDNFLLRFTAPVGLDFVHADRRALTASPDNCGSLMCLDIRAENTQCLFSATGNMGILILLVKLVGIITLRDNPILRDDCAITIAVEFREFAR